MQVILKPVTHDELGEIIVKDDLFPIGRYESPFSEYDTSYIEKLSRRHARIFEQDGIVYIADLGSLNGTTVNGKSVDSTPVRLKRGDEICFTSYLCYRIDILGVSASIEAKEPATPHVQLVLKPQKHQLLLEPIVVSRFPFLINKTSDVFSRYKDSLPSEINYLSRRHAHIFLKEKDIYVEDLGSTNGTFVCGAPLEEHARKLRDGDTIAFGGETFLYTVCLYSAEQDAAAPAGENSEHVTGTAHTVDDVTRTTFVSSANSFLDIFCSEADDEEARQQDGESVAGTDKPDSGKETGSGSGFFHRSRTMLSEVRNAFSDKDNGGSGKFWFVAAAAAAAAVIIISIVYFSDVSTREISDLLVSGDYEEAAVKANHYLELHPDNQKITALATQAALKQVVPDWVDYIIAGKFTAAESAIQQGVRLSYANPQGQQLFDVLTWVTQLEQFSSDRDSPDSPVIMFEEEDSIKELVAWWDEDPKNRRRSLGTISRYVPEFMHYRQQAFSHLRVLQNQQSLFVAAIDRLVVQVRDALGNSNAQSLGSVLSDFESRYPRIRGVGALHRDLEKYLPIESDLQGQYWVKARQAVNLTVFETPVFQDWIGRVATDQLPTDTIMNRYNQSLADWQLGKTESTLAELEDLAADRWGEVAQRSLQHRQQVISDFDQLKPAKGKAGYDRQLLNFYRTLNPVEDIYFADAVADELQLYRSKALNDAARQYTTAETSWKEYLAGGGIRGLHRLEASVSGAYRRLAAQLSVAYDAISKTMEIHSLLKHDASPQQHSLYADISNEVKLQRQSLNELEMVLEPSLKTAKLGLLPHPKEAFLDTAADQQGEQ
jgi:pSer/pThr/pTyr-binding forkhead associated (FHA) protein